MPTFQSEWWNPSEAHTSLRTMLLLFRAHCLPSLGTGCREGGRAITIPAWQQSPWSHGRGPWFSTVRTVRLFENSEGEPMWPNSQSTLSGRRGKSTMITLLQAGPTSGIFEILHLSLSQSGKEYNEGHLSHTISWNDQGSNRRNELLVSCSKFLIVLEVSFETPIHILFSMLVPGSTWIIHDLNF